MCSLVDITLDSPAVGRSSNPDPLIIHVQYNTIRSQFKMRCTGKIDKITQEMTKYTVYTKSLRPP